MVAIQTKFIGPTNFPGSHYKAFTTKDRKTVTLSANDALSSEDNHKAAAMAYCRMMKWDGELAFGGTDEGYVFVFLSRDFGNGPRNITDTLIVAKVAA